MDSSRVRIKEMGQEVAASDQQFEYLKETESLPIDEQSLQDLVEEKLSPQDFRKKLRAK